MKRSLTVSAYLFPSLTMAAGETRVSDPLSLQSVGQMFLGLLVVIGLILILAWAVRRANFVPGYSSGMRIVASLPLGARERAVLVQCGDKQLLLGVSNGSVQLLAQFDEAVITPSEAVPSEFATKLAEILQSRKGR